MSNRKQSYNQGLEEALELNRQHGYLLAYRNRAISRKLSIDTNPKWHGSRYRLTQYLKEWILSSRDGRGVPRPLAMRLRAEGWE